MENSVALYFTIFQSTLYLLPLPGVNSKRVTHYGGRIVGGSEVLASYPFIARIEILTSAYGWFHHCTGSVLTPRVVLTACHCVTRTDAANPGVPPPADTRTMRVRVGITDANDFQNGQVIGVEGVEPHPQCQKGSEYTITNDTGVLILAGALQMTINVQTLRVFSRDVGEAMGELRRLQQSNTRCFVQGWGSTSPIRSNQQLSQRLKESRPFLLTSQQCSDYSCTRPSLASYWCRRDFDRWYQICARDDYSTPCSGDSGAPLICNGLVIGVYSNGADEFCNPGQPAVYADIETILYFVNKYW